MNEHAEPLVSIIVPVYNLRPYLQRCLASIAGQTHRRLQVVLVDDGSTDGSGSLCDEWVGRDDRFTVIHRRNAGVAVTRNVGMDAAEGEYVCFVDGDDYAEPTMVAAARRSDAQIVMCAYRTVAYDHGAYAERSARNGTVDFTVQNNRAFAAMFVPLMRCGMVNPMWGKLFDRGFLDGHRVDEGFVVGSDGMFMYRLYERAARVTAITDVLYDYVVREHSLSGGDFRPGLFDSRERAYLEQHDILKRWNREAIGERDREFLHDVDVCVNGLYGGTCSLSTAERLACLRRVADSPATALCIGRVRPIGVRGRLLTVLLHRRSVGLLRGYGMAIGHAKRLRAALWNMRRQGGRR
ncbi:glycosyltransferase family 2 protein [Bifidobacterium simiarum]|uniref:glycosyltransferase family 2 protein n=1 Tax=Bifidobacterium simiarum TaxID=2045441 RepID=UPI001BDCADFB|nr:glycosyltransferase [Bifidobacterium simiarum]MBT1165723.1 glycosyltransferase [Bifidobacterium simiarum]